ncbi:hypothetical protein ONE63_009567 [Megalurothrips usitatus]|uniref:Uncharacterized protein n=1 Tax=Megalurothrips usitatus TaxID=439358 RepID=A0AAV7XP57_9NEOP|nr:hypothetical protein ONE63_009567 [Megalurothrips usitatus]
MGASVVVRKRWSGSVAAEFIPPTGGRLQGDRLSVGGSARVRVTAEGDAFARFMLCDDKQCSLVDVLGITPDKRISYWTQTEADAEGYRGRFGAGGDLFVPFPSGAHEFVVERRSEKEASVWLASRPDRVATVAVRPGGDRLFVKDPWRGTVRVQFLSGE